MKSALAILTAIVLPIICACASADIIYDESIDGDINTTLISLGDGLNIIVGESGASGTLGVDDEADADEIEILIDEGLELASLKIKLISTNFASDSFSTQYTLGTGLATLDSGQFIGIGVNSQVEDELVLEDNLPYFQAGSSTYVALAQSFSYGGAFGESINSIFGYELHFDVRPIGSPVPLPAPVLLLLLPLAVLYRKTRLSER